MGHFGLEKLKLDNMIKIGFYGGKICAVTIIRKIF